MPTPPASAVGTLQAAAVPGARICVNRPTVDATSRDPQATKTLVRLKTGPSWRANRAHRISVSPQPKSNRSRVASVTSG